MYQPIFPTRAKGCGRCGDLLWELVRGAPSSVEARSRTAISASRPHRPELNFGEAHPYTWPRAQKSVPRTPNPAMAFPQLIAGALGAAESLLLFVKFVRPPRCTRRHFVDGCNLAATMW